MSWALANLVGAKVSLADFSHYYVPVLPGIAILAGAFISFMAQSVARLARSTGYIRLAVTMGAAAGLFISQTDGYLEFYFRMSPAQMLDAQFGAQGQQIFARSDDIAAYVRSVTEPNEEILVWGAEPQIYVLAQRPAASRFVYLTGVAAREGGIETLRSDLLTRQPRVVVTYTQRSPPYLRVRKGLYELLASEGYRELCHAGWLAVYGKGSSGQEGQSCS